MTPRDELIEHWQTRLAESQSPPPTDAPHGQWVRQVYARIYRFLLACYTQTLWSTEPAGNENAPAASAAPMESLIPREGKPPKDAGQIGKVLKAVHAANEQADCTAPKTMTRTAADKQAWIRAAEFRHRTLANNFHRLLHRCAIVSRIVRLAGHFFVEVRRADFDAAMDLMQSHREQLSHAAYRRSAPTASVRQRIHRTILIAIIWMIALILIPVGNELSQVVSESASKAIVTIAAIFVVSISLWCFWGASTIRHL